MANIVFRTVNIGPMVDFWSSALGAERVFENDFIAFLHCVEEHYQMDIISEKDAMARTPRTVGLNYVAFSYNSLQDLFRA